MTGSCLLLTPSDLTFLSPSEIFRCHTLIKLFSHKWALAQEMLLQPLRSNLKLELNCTYGDLELPVHLPSLLSPGSLSQDLELWVALRGSHFAKNVWISPQTSLWGNSQTASNCFSISLRENASPCNRLI